MTWMWAAYALSAADWPQYRGPTHDGVSTESIPAKWPAAGLRQLWKTPLTDGFSSFTVSQGRAFSLVLREIDGLKQEVCVALDADTGKELWSAPLGFAKYDGGGDSGTDNNKGGDGPRSTPSVDGANAYVTSARLVVSCFDAKSGKPNWSRDLMREHGGENIRWQNAASPLIDGDLAFVAGGGTGQALLALNKKDGQVVWKGQDDKMTHATPTATTILGMRQVIFFTQKGLVAVAPKTGDVLWRYDFKHNVSTAISPVVAGDVVYCSAGYGVGAGAVKITKTGDKLASTELWRKQNQLINHWSTPVFKDGYIYGIFNFKEYGKAPLKCVELASGREVWSQEGFGPGNCILAGGNLLVLGDAGQLVLVEATPKAYTELARAQVLTGKCWSTPIVSNGRVYARSTKEGVCMDVSGQSAKQ
ncbi:MAG: PQQ-binding-like beta-propeller repeat protein [Verrucomicrobia bacterium]|nr:PQQ-binding-like beta-propeller repeat protein [Verrucomicrobiota bacterium]